MKRRPAGHDWSGSSRAQPRYAPGDGGTGMQQPDDGSGSNAILRRPGGRELGVVADALRAETVGGGLLLLATVVALILANTPARTAYYQLQHLEIGPAALGLHLNLEEWAADGLL